MDRVGAMPDSGRLCPTPAMRYASTCAARGVRVVVAGPGVVVFFHVVDHGQRAGRVTASVVGNDCGLDASKPLPLRVADG